MTQFINTDLNRYKTSWLVEVFGVSRATIAIWKRDKKIPARQAKNLIKVLENNYGENNDKDTKV